MSNRRIAMINLRSFVPVLIMGLCLTAGVRNVQAQDPIFEQGLKPFGSFQGGDIDNVNLLNGYVNLHIPLVSYPQRGGKLHLDLYLNFAAQMFLTVRDTCESGTNDCYYFTYTKDGIGVGNDFQFFLSRNCTAPASTSTVNGPDGSTHLIGGWSTLSSDGTGYGAPHNTTNPVQGCGAGGYTDSVTDRNGIKKTFGYTGSQCFSWYEDSNGNKISQNFVPQYTCLDS